MGMDTVEGKALGPLMQWIHNPQSYWEFIHDYHHLVVESNSPIVWISPETFEGLDTAPKKYAKLCVGIARNCKENTERQRSKAIYEIS